MANFIVVVDADEKRRTIFLNQIKPNLSPVDGLIQNECISGDFHSVWAATTKAPISFFSNEKEASIIWGDAFYGNEHERIDAEKIRGMWNNRGDNQPPAFDGFYAGLTYSRKYGIIAGADLLGIFPVYYYTKGDVLLLGSSSELFKFHPVFEKEFNPIGLVSILISMHIFNGETLLKGVKRLESGRLLVWQTGSVPKEILQYDFPVSKKYFSLPFSNHVDILDKAIDEAITYNISSGTTYNLMLSGGLDSRMLAGYLKAKNADVEALTLGEHKDLEVKCASKVAQNLSFRHQVIEIASNQYPLFAELQSRWEHGANGFNTIHSWGIHPYLRNSADRVFTGYTLDAVIGTRYINWALSPSSNTMSFESFFNSINAYGIRIDLLKELLRKEVFGDAIEEMKSRIQKVYEGYSDIESQRAWCFNLYHRQRYHVGPILWRLSFGAWPVSPIFDRNVLESAGAMPAATIADRRAQQEIVCKRFPNLAALPLDRNNYNTEPLHPRLRHLLTKHLKYRIGPLNRMYSFLKKKENIERRRYYRIYDINGPGWLAVRHQAESYRENVFHFFNKDILKEILPAPNVKLNLKDEINDASGIKSLLGFMLLTKDHF